MSCLSSLSHAAPWPEDVVDHGGSWIQPLCGMNLAGGLYQLAATYERYPGCVDQVRQLQGMELKIIEHLFVSEFGGIKIRKKKQCAVRYPIKTRVSLTGCSQKLTYLHVPLLSVPCQALPSWF